MEVSFVEKPPASFNRLMPIFHVLTWVSIAGLALAGVGMAHFYGSLVPGASWIGCDDKDRAWCVALLHTVEVPVSVMALVSYVVSLRGSWERRAEIAWAVFSDLVVYAIMVCFEVTQLWASLAKGPEYYEYDIPGLFSVTILVIVEVAIDILKLWLLLPYLDGRKKGIKVWTPQNTKEVQYLVKQADMLGQTLLTMGSSMSPYVERAVVALQNRPSRQVNLISLENLNNIDFSDDAADLLVTAGAGCTLKHLTSQLESRGLAMRSVPGVLGQTLGGSLASASRGGSNFVSMTDLVERLSFIDGTGTLHEVRRSDRDDAKRNEFDAIIGSMGALGIITEVTFRCVKSFKIRGYKSTASWNTAVGTQGGENPPVTASWSLKDETWAQRMMHDPKTFCSKTLVSPEDSSIPDLHWRIELFGASRRASAFVVWSDDSDKNQDNGVKHQKIHHASSAANTGSELEKMACAALLRFFQKYRNPIRPLFRLVPGFFRALQGLFVPTGLLDVRGDWRELAMDEDTGYEKVCPVQFTEFYFDVAQAPEVIERLRCFFEGDKGGDKAGFFIVKLDSAPASSFWLDPAYQRRSLRVNVYAFNGRDSEAEAYADWFFPNFWKVFEDMDFRPHLGKHVYFPSNYEDHCKMLVEMFPKYRAFDSLREKLDPNGTLQNQVHAKIFPSSPGSAKSITAAKKKQQ